MRRDVFQFKKSPITSKGSYMRYEGIYQPVAALATDVVSVTQVSNSSGKYVYTYTSGVRKSDCEVYLEATIS